ncbi:MAG: TetR/AcrR family transcriptional regulator [Phycisphaerales bacterium]|nr:TetR/AcrR family transcriptional regulator [Phycisphaerales bacterium]
MPPSRRDELIDAAMRVYARSGFHHTGLDVVLQEAGVSRMTLYNHFKSKDELIVAALRRRDEIFRNRMMKFVESRAADPIGRLLAVFDYHEDWFAARDFCGCMFINASAEFCDPRSPVRRVAADHKRDVLRYLRDHCETAGLTDPAAVAEHLNLLLEGAICAAHVVGRVGLDGATPPAAARSARAAAEILIAAARAA